MSLGLLLGVCLAEEPPYEVEYRNLYEATMDKSGLESIRVLHKQLDDDNDGAIEPSETGDFIRGDLQKDQQQQQMRQTQFHRRDLEITVKDLWNTWWKSEVHNWTVDQTVNWLVKNVELPQYELNFGRHAVDGAKLPQVAVGSSYLSKVLGVSNPIHRSGITLKAMDVVLFGPPKEILSSWKDTILTILLLVATSCLLYAFRLNKRSQEHLRKMASDMESLTKAEEELETLQANYQQRNLATPPPTPENEDDIEVSKLKEEVEVLRNELQRAEIELEDRCWIAPPVLQQWLQLTYELESQVYNAKKKSAENQLEVAKDLCEKLKKKRSSLVGAFVSTHGCSIDEVDKSILEAKMALLEVTQDLAERTQRWRQIEALCGCPIVTNPGLNHLKSMVRSVNVTRLTRMAMGSTDMSSDDGGVQDDPFEDARSMVTSSVIASRLTTTTLTAVKSMKGQRGSSIDGKDSGTQAEETKEIKPVSRLPSQSTLLALTYNRSGTSLAALGSNQKIGPGGRKMVKSFSHGAGSSMATLAAALAAKDKDAKMSGEQSGLKSGITSSVSDTHLQAKSTTPEVGTWLEEASNEDLSGSGNVLDDSSNPSDERDEAESEESGSLHSDAESNEKPSSKKSKKLKKFFNFGRKKEKVV